MQILASALIVLVSCILYMGFGSLVCVRRGKSFSAPITLIVGFFLYYGLFAIICLPIMLTYRPLSLLTTAWIIVVVLVMLLAIILHGKDLIVKIRSVAGEIADNKAIAMTFVVLTVIQVLLVVCTYSFTLDAAYYVANVSTSVDTNMINVYDPFTGAWQDHFELRYVFATYSIHDAVVCQLTGIPALIETKTVMSAVVMLMVNCLYIWIVRFMWGENRSQGLIMYIAMIFINLTFITLYTSSNFLMNRTYEGKSIVGNITVIAIFAMYMIAVRYGTDLKYWIMLFVICFGTATISSTANMIIPAQLCILFTPYVITHKRYRDVPKLIICMMPEAVMLIMYVLYVKGFFAIYTYPR